MTDKKTPPSGKEEVTDVLSSIRRLVSDELREKRSAPDRSGAGLLSLDNDRPPVDMSPLVLSDKQVPLTDLRPDPPLTASTSPLVLPGNNWASTAGKDDSGQAGDPVGPVAEGRPKRQEPRIEIGLTAGRVAPVDTDSSGLPKPIRMEPPLRSAPSPTEPVETESRAILPADPKDTKQEALTDEPDAGPADKTDEPRPELEALHTKVHRSRITTPGLEEKLSPFALASLNKPAPSKPDSEGILDQVQADTAEAQDKKPLRNPFARSRQASETGSIPEIEKTPESAAAPTAEADETAPDPEFDSFQSAEQAFAELSEAKEVLKTQGAFSGVQSVIESASFSFTGTIPKPEATGQDAEADTRTSDEMAPETVAEASRPAPFFDESELRQIVTEIVREELAGELGEKLSRNIRKIIRREIALALSDEDNSGILGD